MKRMKFFSVFIFLIFMSAALFTAGCGSSEDSKSGASTLNLEPASTEYPNASLLVSGDSVKNSLGAPGLVIIDARSNTAYTAGHIPGAINVIHSDFWTKGIGLNSLTDLETKLGAAGLSRDITIVIYDNTSASWGAAGRLFWMLEYLGCTNVHIINGGWDKWVADGKTTETTVNTLPAATFTASVNASVSSTKESIMDKIMNNDFAVIDARTDEEYIGWKLYGETRGGHIPGAVQIPYEWFYNTDKTVLSNSDLRTLFESRGINTYKEVTAYCTAGIRSGFVYFALRLMGHTKASNYDASIWDWDAASASEYPMEKLTNYHKLVHVQWVKDLINSTPGNPTTYPDTYTGNGYVIVEVQSSSPYYGSSTDYDNGHIPGAIHTGPDDLEFGINDTPVLTYFYPHYRNPADGALLDDAAYIAKVESWGITSNTTVIVYGTKTGSSVFRVAWMLMYAGVEDVRVINGGYTAWVASGGTIDTVAHDPVNVAFGATAPIHPEYLATAADVDVLRQQSKNVGVVADIRKWEEFTGELNPYTSKFDLCTFDTKGHIPGAVWAHNSTDLVDGSSSDTLRSYTEVEQMWKDSGITPGKKIIFHCGTGWRSSQAFFFAHLMGFSDVSNYNGSWFEWSWPVDGRPIATGPQ